MTTKRSIRKIAESAKAGIGSIVPLPIDNFEERLYVRKLALRERLDAVQRKDGEEVFAPSLRLAASAVCNADGSPFLSPDEWEAFATEELTTFNVLIGAVQRVLGLRPVEETVTEGNESSPTLSSG